MSNISSKKLNVIFAGCARDCEKFIQKSLDNIKYYSSFFNKSIKIIVENGSNDKTREILEKNKNPDDLYLNADHLNNLPIRGLRLEKARNLIVEKIKNDLELKQYDLLIILDLDGSGNYKIKKEHLTQSIDFLFSDKKTGAVFANQLGTYYDMWTLRHSKLCKNDFWAEALQKITLKINQKDKISQKILDEISREFLSKKTFIFDAKLDPIKVLSAFGGFGIYKMKSVLQNNRLYKGTQIIDLEFKDSTKVKINYQQCEHVNFNLGLIDEGYDLYILPYLINREYVDVIFPPQAAINLIIKNKS